MLQHVFFPKENCITIAQRLFTELQVRVSPATIEKELTEHPDYPSLLSISDVLSNHGIENIAFRTDASKLEKIEGPFITLIKDPQRGEQFALVRSAADLVTWYNTQKEAWETVGPAAFLALWSSGIVLIVDGTSAVHEKDYEKKRREEKRTRLAAYSAFLSLPALVLGAAVLTFFQQPAAAVYPILYSLLTLAGCIVSGLIIGYELGEYNPILQQLCTTSKKVNCGAILNSSASKFMGIRWSVIGFSYFTGTLLFMLFNNMLSAQTLFVISWLNTLALPYVLFSVIYQWRIAKQWCRLCLIIQGLLVLQGITALIPGWHHITSPGAIVPGTLLVPLALACLIPFIALSLLLPAWRSAREGKRNRAELQRLKHDPRIFEALLARQRPVTEDPKGLGITLGNPHPKYTIIKVCNPYCGPCARAHSPMEEILRNNPDVQLQIIFTATTREGDRLAPPVKHLLAIAGKINDAGNNEGSITKALDDWYLADKKDYNSFAMKYPMNGELAKYDSKIAAMDEWCTKMDIRSTPTFFINGNQLPQIYSINDLKYFLTV